MDDYLLKQVSEGRKIDVLLLSHNSSWNQLKLIDRKLDDFNVHTYGESVSYLDFLHHDEPFTEDVDLILLYSSESFSEDELEDLKDLASYVAKKKDKRVSVGYSYVVPRDKRTDKKVPFAIKLISYTKESIDEEEVDGTQHFTALDLAGLTLGAHDALVNASKKASPLKLMKKLTNGGEPSK